MHYTLHTALHYTMHCTLHTSRLKLTYLFRLIPALYSMGRLVGRARAVVSLGGYSEASMVEVLWCK